MAEEKHLGIKNSAQKNALKVKGHKPLYIEQVIKFALNIFRYIKTTSSHQRECV